MLIYSRGKTKHIHFLLHFFFFLNKKSPQLFTALNIMYGNKWLAFLIADANKISNSVANKIEL